MKKTEEHDNSQRLLSRREFLTSTAMATGAAWISLTLPRPLAAKAAAMSSKPLVLSEKEWKALETITAHIIPSDETPGAVEAGCVNFIDKALANEDAEAAPLYKGGLAALDAVCMKTFEKPYAETEPIHQVALLTMLEDGKLTGWPDEMLPQQQFFETVRVHTVIGFLADPSYGGNKNHAGWKTMGYPGPAHHRRGYTPEQLIGKAPIKSAWDE